VLDVLYEGLGISKLQFLIQKRKKIQLHFFSSDFGHQSLGSGLDPDPDSCEMLDSDPKSINPDQQLRFSGDFLEIDGDFADRFPQ
jgi:hypothetical protein